ncbi:MAG: bifunctional heptose 7-phosphate kinase/heptose 1-phosphate adenyltransferase, partial [Candidatus Dadabacteria bacterium]|nr:bifunctional heptose 7-phosphate kinase/heptose 1-phosphate adenyltransferase [Candidatus Dadabacteria bacterium]
MLDRYIFGTASRISPEAPVPVLKAKEEIESLGGAGNVAVNLKSLGALVELIGTTGEDT